MPAHLPFIVYPTLSIEEVAEHVELKYCESCGRLFFRRAGSDQKYCSTHSYLQERNPVRLASLLLSGSPVVGIIPKGGPVLLAAAILQGQRLVHFIPGVLRPGRKKQKDKDGDCLAGACLAAGVEPRYETIKEIWPWTSAGVGLPCGCRGSNVLNVRLAICHLFDVHVMERKDLTLEQLARWVFFVDPTASRQDQKPCSSAKHYKGKRAPQCNGGVPCNRCLSKFLAQSAPQGPTRVN